MSRQPKVPSDDSRSALKGFPEGQKIAENQGMGVGNFATVLHNAVYDRHQAASEASSRSHQLIEASSDTQAVPLYTPETPLLLLKDLESFKSQEWQANVAFETKGKAREGVSSLDCSPTNQTAADGACSPFADQAEFMQQQSRNLVPQQDQLEMVSHPKTIMLITASL